jgi:hypothetical protein
VRGNHLTPVEAATGTPAGVGMPRGEFNKAGDEVQIEIANCGRLTPAYTSSRAACSARHSTSCFGKAPAAISRSSLLRTFDT